MAMSICGECKNPVSTSADTCPHCGCRLCKEENCTEPAGTEALAERYAKSINAAATPSSAMSELRGLCAAHMEQFAAARNTEVPPATDETESVASSQSIHLSWSTGRRKATVVLSTVVLGLTVAGLVLRFGFGVGTVTADCSTPDNAVRTFLEGLRRGDDELVDACLHRSFYWRWGIQFDALEQPCHKEVETYQTTEQEAIEAHRVARAEGFRMFSESNMRFMRLGEKFQDAEWQAQKCLIDKSADPLFGKRAFDRLREHIGRFKDIISVEDISPIAGPVQPDSGWTDGKCDRLNRLLPDGKVLATLKNTAENAFLVTTSQPDRHRGSNTLQQVAYCIGVSNRDLQFKIVSLAKPEGGTQGAASLDTFSALIRLDSFVGK